MMLEPEVEEYYNNYFELFMQVGWDQFMADVQSAADTIQLLALQDAKTDNAAYVNAASDDTRTISIKTAF